MPNVSYKRSSNYSRTPIRNNELSHYEIPFVVDFTRTKQFEIVQKYNKRPDRLAYDLYENSKLWWIFVLYNRNQILDPIHDFTIGKVILVPDKSVVSGL